MKIKKSFLKIDNIKIDTYVAIYFEGNKEEISIEKKEIYLYSKELDSFEYWIKISSISEDKFLKYISNKETLLNIINSSKISLFKREFEAYDSLDFVENLDSEANIKKYEILLPNKLAVLGYDFVKIINNEKKRLYISFDLSDQYEKRTTKKSLNPIENRSVKLKNKKDEYSSYSTHSIYKKVA